MYAIVEKGGKQYKVKEGDTLVVDRLPVDPKDGESQVVELSNVMLAWKEDEAPLLNPKGASVRCTFLRHEKLKKLFVLKMRRRKNSRRRNGFRRQVSVLKVDRVVVQ